MDDLSLRVARRFQAATRPDLRKILMELEDLEDLSNNLEDLEGRFNQHFAAVGSEVVSQLEALEKARQGLKAARGLKDQVALILEQFPDDKTAKRSASDADTMVKRFEKHESAAAKMIRALTKKELPKALKAIQAKATTGIKAKLVDPSKLQVIPWQNPNALAPDFRGPRGVEYQIVFRIVDPDLKDRFQGGKADVIVAEHSASTAGPYFRNYSGVQPDAKPKDVVERFLKNLEGWPGIKGEGEAIAARSTTAKEIGRSLGNARFGGQDVDRPKISKDNRKVDIAYRSWDLPKEGAYGMNEYDYEQMVEKELKNAKAVVVSALRHLKGKYGDIQLGVGEKGWVYITVTVK